MNCVRCGRHLCAAGCDGDHAARLGCGACACPAEPKVKQLDEEVRTIRIIEAELQGLDMPTALRVLEFVRSRVVAGAL